MVSCPFWLCLLPLPYKALHTEYKSSCLVFGPVRATLAKAPRSSVDCELEDVSCVFHGTMVSHWAAAAGESSPMRSRDEVCHKTPGPSIPSSRKAGSLAAQLVPLRAWGDEGQAPGTCSPSSGWCRGHLSEASHVSQEETSLVELLPLAVIHREVGTVFSTKQGTSLGPRKCQLLLLFLLNFHFAEETQSRSK